MDNETLRELQLAELQMLKDFHDFCEENGIVYFIYAGTLLGAVRHQGFIPWDDDIDVCMDVKNYRKFLRIARKRLPERYFLQNYRTDPKVDFMWSKIRMNGTTSMYRNRVHYDIHWGICMDIFVLAGVRKSQLGRNLQQWSWSTIVLLLHEHYARAAGTFIHPKINFVYKCLPMPIRKIVCELLEACLLADTHSHEMCYNTWHSQVGKAAMKSEVFLPENRKLIKFEDGLFYAPSNAEECLTVWYGDWKQLPPVEERGGHGDIIVDLKNSYTKYMKKV